MKKLLIIGALAAAAFAGNPNTGCGLGSMVIQNQDSLLKQVLAATTNSISGNQTFGITSGTLGCEKPTKFVNNEKLQNFVTKNMDQIAMDAARGNGESIKTLAKLMNVKDVNSFAANLHDNFDKIFVSENVNSAQVIDNIAKYAI
jgi:hypothetical protein